MDQIAIRRRRRRIAIDNWILLLIFPERMPSWRKKE
jgi:hypothetical protein